MTQQSLKLATHSRSAPSATSLHADDALSREFHPRESFSDVDEFGQRGLAGALDFRASRSRIVVDLATLAPSRKQW